MPKLEFDKTSDPTVSGNCQRIFFFFFIVIHAMQGLAATTSKFKEAIDRGNEFGALLSDLSKAFDCINHPLLVAKLYNYGVSPFSFNMNFSYLSNRTHRTKISECFSERDLE